MLTTHTSNAGFVVVQDEVEAVRSAAYEEVYKAEDEVSAQMSGSHETIQCCLSCLHRIWQGVRSLPEQMGMHYPVP